MFIIEIIATYLFIGVIYASTSKWASKRAKNNEAFDTWLILAWLPVLIVFILIKIKIIKLNRV
jgi:glycerol uptake facilitator-like aquaporin